MGDEVKESRRELLSKAWDEIEEKEEKTVKEEKPEVEVESTTEVSDAQPEKDTKEVTAEPTEPKPEDADKKEAKAAADFSKQQKPVEAAPVTDRAPNSWKPAIREHWAKLPPDVRAEVTRREREIQQTLSQTAQVRKFANDFAQVVNPYAHLIRTQNSTPLEAVNNLMQTAAGLMQGNVQQKAAIVAEIIGNYGVDIQALDKILSSGPATNARQPVEAVPQWARPVFDFMGNMQKMQNQAQQRLAEEADRDIAAAESKPFFDDLRDDIADIMEVAANRGRKMSIEQAYTVALNANPEIKKIVDQRERATRNPVSEAAATLARARKAASTVVGAPSTAKKAGDGKLTRRQQLSEAWDDSVS
jgi:hypothetical protein